MGSRGMQIVLGIAIGIIGMPILAMMLFGPPMKTSSVAFEIIFMGSALATATSLVSIIPYGRPYTLRLVAGFAPVWLIASLVFAIFNLHVAKDLRPLLLVPVLAWAMGFFALTGRLPHVLMRLIVPNYPTPTESDEQ